MWLLSARASPARRSPRCWLEAASRCCCSSASSAYRDRVRGEYMAPWGVLEARALGLESVIRSTEAVDARYTVPFDELVDPAVAAESTRDNSTFLPDVAGSLCASHPRSCRALAEEAVRAGAQLVRGVAEVHVRAGKRPAITFRNGT